MIDENKLKQALIRREVTTVMYDIVDREISYLPKEEVIPLDRIKEAREEMVNGMPSIRTEGQLTGEDVVFSTACECYAECIMILDKLIAELEGE